MSKKYNHLYVEVRRLDASIQWNWIRLLPLFVRSLAVMRCSKWWVCSGGSFKKSFWVARWLFVYIMYSDKFWFVNCFALNDRILGKLTNKEKMKKELQEMKARGLLGSATRRIIPRRLGNLEPRLPSPCLVSPSFMAPVVFSSYRLHSFICHKTQQQMKLNL